MKFSQKMSLNFFYTIMVHGTKKSKNDQKLKVLPMAKSVFSENLCLYTFRTR